MTTLSTARRPVDVLALLLQGYKLARDYQLIDPENRATGEYLTTNVVNAMLESKLLLVSFDGMFNLTALAWRLGEATIKAINTLEGAK